LLLDKAEVEWWLLLFLYTFALDEHLLLLMGGWLQMK
jgi:hypothetical protein